MAIVLWLCGLQVSLYAQNATKLSPKVMAAMNAPLAKLKDDDPPLIRLKKERFNAALKEAKARSDFYNRGLTRLPELIDVGQRLFAAEVDLYDQAEQKAQVLQRQLDVITEAEFNTEKWVKRSCRPVMRFFPMKPLLSRSSGFWRRISPALAIANLRSRYRGELTRCCRGRSPMSC